MRAVWCCLFLILPVGAEAAVSFSEVAWMGSTESANHEWIELHNDGGSTDVSGWVITDGMNLEIELSGEIPAGAYAVLERTSDATVSGSAFLIYTGALVNTGATLRLERGDGSLVDQVPGGENWENIGGDNTTKETAQYTSKGWKTAPATPGTGLVWSEEIESVPAEPATSDDAPKTTIAKKSPKSGEPVRLTVPDMTLALDVDAQTVGYVHQPISFTVTPSGIGESLIDSLAYQWNFGDGFTSGQKEPEYVFHYPGTYVVTVHAGYKRQEQVARHEITILPVKISLTTNREGDVQVNNDSPYELDISGYRLRGEQAFTFPPYSVLLPNQTVTIPKEKLGRTEERMVGFYDTEVSLVSSLTPQTLAFATTEESSTDEPQPQISALSFSPSLEPEPANFSFTPTLVVDEEFVMEPEPEKEIVAEKTQATSTQIASVGAAVPESGSRMGYLALAGVLGLGVLGVYAAPRRNEMG